MTIIVLSGILAFVHSSAPAQTAASHPVNATEKRRAVMDLARLLRARYAIPGMAETAARAIEKQLARGAYDSIRDARTFGEAVSSDLRAVTQDKHLQFGIPTDPPSSAANAPVKPADPEVERAYGNAEIRRGNFGLSRVESFRETSDCSR